MTFGSETEVVSVQPSRAEFIEAFGADPLRLPDVLAVDTAATDWPTALRALNSYDWSHRPAAELALPPDGLSNIPFTPSPGVRVNLFPGEVIAFDFDLAEMRDQLAVDSVCQIARLIGRSTNSIVVFLPEGEPLTSAVLRYQPGIDAFEFVSDAG